MKKLILPSLVVWAVLPGLAFAAYDDVTLTTDVDIVINGITLDVAGSTNVVESITVGDYEFSFTLLSGSTIKISSPTFKRLTSNAEAKFRAGRVCESNESSITHSSSDDAATITVYLSSLACPEGSSVSGSSSGGGGDGGTAVANVIAGTPVQSATAVTIASLQAQLNSLLAQLAALQGTSVSAGAKGLINANLSSGSRGPSVRALQAFLNAQGFIVASSGPGSPGQETETYGNLTVQAVQKFQKEYGIVSSGTPGTTGYGRVGPKTRAKINELSGN